MKCIRASLSVKCNQQRKSKSDKIFVLSSGEVIFATRYEPPTTAESPDGPPAVRGARLQGSHLVGSHVFVAGSKSERFGVNSIKLFFLLRQCRRKNKLEYLSLETLSSQVLEFEDKARLNPIGAPFRCFLLG
jgi:hypothetical protein